MVKLVATSWVEGRLDSPDVLVLDPRRPMKHLQGHLKGAVNLPLSRILSSDGHLRPAEELAGELGSLGLDEGTTPIIYDSYDGQSGAFLAWVLEFLGRTDVCLMEVFFEGWLVEKREVFYRPVTPIVATFTPRVSPGVRATLEDIQDQGGVKLLDVRSEDEYRGEAEIDDRPGHIPGATNLVWRELLGKDNRLLDFDESLTQRLRDLGIDRDDEVITYCRTGPRAAVAYLALQQLGYKVRLYDGSYAQWSAANMPVEV